MTVRHYFAYGSNLNQADLVSFLARFKLDTNLVSSMKPLRAAWLPDRALRFTRYSPSRQGGVLDVIHQLGALTPGMVFEVDNPQVWEALDLKEGVAEADYQPLDTSALTSDGRALPVRTYQVCASHRQPYVPPSESYLRVVREGYAAHHLATHALEPAATNLPQPALASGLFVYGTLLQGHSRHHLVTGLGLKDLQEAHAPGRLVDCGQYPGLIPDDNKTARGEMQTPNDLPALLSVLDPVEGFLGFGHPDNLYRRGLLEVTTARGPSLAWTYVLDRPSTGLPEIPDGDWRAWRTTK